MENIWNAWKQRTLGEIYKVKLILSHTQSHALIQLTKSKMWHFQQQIQLPRDSWSCRKFQLATRHRMESHHTASHTYRHRVTTSRTQAHSDPDHPPSLAVSLARCSLECRQQLPTVPTQVPKWFGERQNSFVFARWQEQYAIACFGCSVWPQISKASAVACGVKNHI